MWARSDSKWIMYAGRRTGKAELGYKLMMMQALDEMSTENMENKFYELGYNTSKGILKTVNPKLRPEELEKFLTHWLFADKTVKEVMRGADTKGFQSLRYGMKKAEREYIARG